MKYRTLGRTNLKVSVLGLGSGGENRLGQTRNAPEAGMHRLIHRALDLGINMFDTAPTYMDSEVVLGSALQGVPRDSYVLASKCRIKKPADRARDLVHESLRRLKTDYLDILFLHGVSLEDYPDVIARSMDDLLDLRQSGLVRFFGITEDYEADATHEVLKRALHDGYFDVLMAGHNMLSPSALEYVFPEAERQNIGVVVMCAVRSVMSKPERLESYVQQWKKAGMLAPDSVPDSGPFDWVLGPDVEDMTAAAYKFALEPKSAGCVLTGTSSEEHLEANVRAILGPPLADEVSKRLRGLFMPIAHPVTYKEFETRAR